MQNKSVNVLITGENIPSYSYSGDAGCDLISNETLSLRSGGRALVGTGIKIALPFGYAAYIMPRSGLAAKHGITVLNAPGIVDAGYRGEIKVILYNSSNEDFQINKGDRIAQIVIQKVYQANFNKVEILPESLRDEGGFGSSGGFNKS